jgi:lantibiotic leader peptide-processing serine protease
MSHRASCCGFSLVVLAGLAACSGSPEDAASSSSVALTGERSFIVVYKQRAIPQNVATAVASAGGRLVQAFPAIGVAVARSTQVDFRRSLATHREVAAVAETSQAGLAALAVSVPDRKLPGPRVPRGPATQDEPLAEMQWNMDQIHAAEARRITRGRKSVVVGVFDSGIDDTLEDLKGQVDPGRSVTCIGGQENTDPESWAHDVIGHGSHVAGIIAAKQNGVGIVGVAPGASLAAVKLTEDGLVYPEAFICGLNWAGAHGFDVVNASVFVDPWYYTCRRDPEQRAIWIAVQRAVQYAQRRGVAIIASTGNENQDLAHPTVDPFSPTDGTPSEREISNACELLPVELDGVIGVSGLGGDRKLAFYSNYGLGVVDVTAPGGDLHVPMPGNASGQIVSDIPAYSLYYQAAQQWNGRIGINCSDGLDPNDPNSDPSSCAETYALLQGTSLAAPHVAGVAALVISRFGNLRPRELFGMLRRRAIPQACPENPYQPYPEDMPPATCEGQRWYNGFYGFGAVDALASLRWR